MEQPRNRWAALHWEAAGQQRGGGQHLPRRPACLEATARRRKGDGRTLIGDSGNDGLPSLRPELLNAAGHRFRWRRPCPLCNGCNAGRPFEHGAFDTTGAIRGALVCVLPNTRTSGRGTSKCTTAPAAAGHVRPPSAGLPVGWRLECLHIRSIHAHCAAAAPKASMWAATSASRAVSAAAGHITSQQRQGTNAATRWRPSRRPSAAVSGFGRGSGQGEFACH